MAIDIASKPMKSILQSVRLWHGRYRITESRPEHTSATCYVFKGVDDLAIDTETGEPTRVALKLMRVKAQFERELTARSKEFDNHMVMNVLQQKRPIPLPSQGNRGVYLFSELGVYSKSTYRCVESVQIETL